MLQTAHHVIGILVAEKTKLELVLSISQEIGRLKVAEVEDLQERLQALRQDFGHGRKTDTCHSEEVPAHGRNR